MDHGPAGLDARSRLDDRPPPSPRPVYPPRSAGRPREPDPAAPVRSHRGDGVFRPVASPRPGRDRGPRARSRPRRHVIRRARRRLRAAGAPRLAAHRGPRVRGWRGDARAAGRRGRPGQDHPGRARHRGAPVVRGARARPRPRARRAARPVGGRTVTSRLGLSAWTADPAAWRSARAKLPPGVNAWAAHPLVVASIDYVKQPDVLAAAAAVPWDLLVVDEAHNAGVGSDRRVAADALAARSTRVLLVTATPHAGDDDGFEALCAIGARGPGDPAPRLVRRRREEAGLAPGAGSEWCACPCRQRSGRCTSAARVRAGRSGPKVNAARRSRWPGW